jgi:hypothetical protein
LADILMGELSYLQVHQHNAPEQEVVEDEINVEILVGESNAMLPCYE